MNRLSQSKPIDAGKMNRTGMRARWIFHLLFLLLLAGAGVAGDLFVHWIVPLAHAGNCPIGIINRFVAGHGGQTLSNCLAGYVRLWWVCYLSISGWAVFLAMLRLGKQRHVRGTAVAEAALVVLSAVAILSQRFFAQIGSYDEGLILTGAWQFSLGAVPYRDFYNIYGPGQVGVLGGLFAVFGKSLVLARVYDLVIRMGIVVAIWGIIRPYLTPFRRMMAHWTVVSWVYYFGQSLCPVWAVLLCQLLAISILLQCGPAVRPGCAFLAGLFSGGAILFRHDIGSLFALLLFAGLWWWLPTACDARPAKGHVLVVFLLGTALLPFLAYGTLFVLVPFPVLWQRLVEYSLFVFPPFRTLPFPPPSDFLAMPRRTLAFYCFPLLVACAFVWLMARFHGARNGRNVSKATRAVFLLLLLAVAGLPQAFGRSDMAHLVSLSIPAVVLFFLMLPLSRRALPGAVLFLFWSASYAVPLVVEGAFVPFAAESILPPVVPALRDAVAQCPPGPVFAGNQNHDRLVINDAGLYFLLDRLPGTYYYWFDPGVVTTPSVQTEIVGELEANRVQTVILWDEPPRQEPNRSSEDSRARVLDPYIRAHYGLATNLPPYSVWRRSIAFENPLPK